MRDERYKHNKWFIGIISVLIVWMVMLGNSGNPDDGWGVVALFSLLVGILGFWPVDYLIHKKTVRQFKDKPVQIDPNFARKRNAMLILFAAASIVWIGGGAIFGD